MKTTGNTILITGGGTGLGRGLAEALHKAGNQVIIAGRRREVLEETAKANPGMKTSTLDVASAESIRTVAAQLIAENPELNVVINMAGVMYQENLKTASDTKIAEQTIEINLLGTIRTTTAFLPHLLKQSEATIINVSSGLAFVPLPGTPTYSATKAAVHSYTESMRVQLAGTSVEVVEIEPPYVQTDLTPGQAKDPRAMPLKDYIEESIELLSQQPTPKEIQVKNVLPLRYAEKNGSYDAVLSQLSQMFAESHT